MLDVSGVVGGETDRFRVLSVSGAGLVAGAAVMVSIMVACLLVVKET
jgi:hypothetical protein